MNKKLVKRMVSIIAILLIAIFAIAGCGSDDNGSGSNDANEGSASSSSESSSSSGSDSSSSSSKDSASFEDWEPFQVEPGEFFKYKTKTTDEDGNVEEGWFTLNILPEDEDQVTIEAAGESGENSFSFSITDNKDDAFSKIMIQMMINPASKNVISTIYSPFVGGGWHIAATGGQLKVGNKSSYSTGEHSVSTEVVGKKKYAGVEGFVIVSEIDGELESEICISPDFPLSLMSHVKAGDQVFEAELVEYTAK